MAAVIAFRIPLPAMHYPGLPLWLLAGNCDVRMLLEVILPQGLRGKEINLLTKGSFRFELDTENAAGQSFGITNRLHRMEWIFKGFKIITDINETIVHVNPIKSPQDKFHDKESASEDEQQAYPQKRIGK